MSPAVFEDVERIAREESARFRWAWHMPLCSDEDLRGEAVLYIAEKWVEWQADGRGDVPGALMRTVARGRIINRVRLKGPRTAHGYDRPTEASLDAPIGNTDLTRLGSIAAPEDSPAYVPPVFEPVVEVLNADRVAVTFDHPSDGRVTRQLGRATARPMLRGIRAYLAPPYPSMRDAANIPGGPNPESLACVLTRWGLGRPKGLQTSLTYAARRAGEPVEPVGLARFEVARLLAEDPSTNPRRVAATMGISERAAYRHAGKSYTKRLMLRRRRQRQEVFRYIRGETKAVEVANVLGISRSRVYQIASDLRAGSDYGIAPYILERRAAAERNRQRVEAGLAPLGAPRRSDG